MSYSIGAHEDRRDRGRSKRAGGRVIYFVPTGGESLYLLDIYAKGEKEDLTDADRKEIRRYLEALAAIGRQAP